MEQVLFDVKTQPLYKLTSIFFVLFCSILFHFWLQVTWKLFFLFLVCFMCLGM